MPSLTREAILGADDVTTEKVDCPLWGGYVLVRGMTGKQRDEFEESLSIQVAGQQAKDYRNATARFVSRCVVDEAGELLFPDPKYVEALGEKDGATLLRVFAVARKLSGLDSDDREELSADFGGAAGGGSSSSSPNGSARPKRGSSAKSAATS